MLSRSLNYTSDIPHLISSKHMGTDEKHSNQPLEFSTISCEVFVACRMMSFLLKAPSICLWGWYSSHMKSVFNAPASAAANGWYMLYNHRGREKPHFSALPSTENTDRTHSDHFKLQDLTGRPEAIQNRPTDSQWSGQAVTPQRFVQFFNQSP